ncbi:hypothetical protein niasHT_032559 [Heterodera trifolii]|uniref:Uncharacterized protein n=1 Tax=Heterodera trifolii TaxID=157864 RepID=A0ABD2J7H2_9BILA
MFCKASFLLVIFGSIFSGTFGSDNEDEQWDGASSSTINHDDDDYNAYENADFLPTSHVFAALTLPKFQANPLRKALSLNSSPISMRKSNENSHKFELRRYKSFSEAEDWEREKRTKKTMAQMKSTKWYNKQFAANPEKTMKQDELLANFLSSPLPPLPPRKNSSKNTRKSISINDQLHDPSWINDTKINSGQSSRNKTYQNNQLGQLAKKVVQFFSVQSSDTQKDQKPKNRKNESGSTGKNTNQSNDVPSINNQRDQISQKATKDLYGQPSETTSNQKEANRKHEAGPSEMKSNQNEKNEMNEGTPSEKQIDKTKTNRLLKAKEILPLQQKE